jgi:hypothetical protein
MLQIVITEERVEAALGAGELLCPGCSGRLSPWGFARAREVRVTDGTRLLRPRRARCSSCAATHVLVPCWTIPRRRDSSAVIGQALDLAVSGDGHRRIARRLGRPPTTVRGWLRAAHTRADGLRGCAIRWLVVLDPEPVAVCPAGSEIGDMVEAIMLAVRAWVLRFGHDRAGPWERAVWLTGGLLHGAGHAPP